MCDAEKSIGEFFANPHLPRNLLPPPILPHLREFNDITPEQGLERFQLWENECNDFITLSSDELEEQLANFTPDPDEVTIEHEQKHTLFFREMTLIRKLNEILPAGCSAKLLHLTCRPG
jgi:hypothetical protein